MTILLTIIKKLSFLKYTEYTHFLIRPGDAKQNIC